MLLTRALERQMKDEKEAERQVRTSLIYELFLNVGLFINGKVGLTVV
jgi:hypothetical protein